MNTKAFVLNEEGYEKKLAEAANIFVDKNTKQPLPYAEVGKKLYVTRGCSQCHSINGAEGTGPTWKGLYKRDVDFSNSERCRGYTLNESDDDAKWDAYLRESILYPDAKIVQGFQNNMPSQESEFSGSPYKEKSWRPSSNTSRAWEIPSITADEDAECEAAAARERAPIAASR